MKLLTRIKAAARALMVAEPAEQRAPGPTSTLSNPAAWLLDVFSGGGASASGINVTHQTALQYSPVWRAVALISSDVAKLPLNVFRREGDGKELAREHPAFPILRRRASGEVGAFNFKRSLTDDALRLGNGYGYIFRDSAGAPFEMLRMDPLGTWLERRGDGSLVYITHVGGRQTPLEPRDVFHLQGPGDGLCGRNVISFARDSLGLGMVLEAFSSYFFKNNAEPGIILKNGGHLNDKALDRLRVDFNKLHAGHKQARKTAVLPLGVEIEQIKASNEDAQLLGGREFQIRDVANFFGVPAHKLGDTTRTAFASLEQENQSYLNEALDPWLVAWEEEAWRKLLTEPERQNDTHIVEFNRRALVRADMVARFSAYTSALGGAPFMTRDEVRACENLNPLPDGVGATVLDPLNMAGDNDATAGDDQGDADDQDAERAASQREAAEKLLEAFLERMARRIMAQAERRAKKPAALCDWVDGVFQSEQRPFDDQAEPVVLAALALGVESVSARSAWSAFVAASTAALCPVLDGSEARTTETIAAARADLLSHIPQLAKDLCSDATDN